MAVVDLYNGIYSVLSNDTTVLSYLGILNSSDDVDEYALMKARHIQKRAKPQNLADNIPLISFYTAPGRRDGRNLEVYTTDFVFDIFTNDDVPLAQDIAQRVMDLFEGVVTPFVNVENFEGFFITAYESESDLPDTYCFSVVIRFSITMERVQCT